MGFFSNLKNSITGGWADVSVDTSNARRGEPLGVAVNVSVRSEDVSADAVYVKLECREVVEIANYRITDHDDGEPDTDYVNVHKREKLFSRRVNVARGVSLEGNSEQSFEGQIEIPENLPPSYRGKHSRVEWVVHAGLDMKGNDPDSGWQQLHVE